MKKLTLEEKMARLKEALKKKNSELKKYKQRDKYNKQVKKQLKAELKTEQKKTSNKRKHLSELPKTNLEQRIKERFSDVNTQNVLLELASSFISGSSADSEA